MDDLELRHQLVLEAPVRLADGAGGFTETWTPRATVWASMRATTSRAREATGGTATRQDWVIITRAASPGAPDCPAPGNRFRKENQIFIITGAAILDAGGRYIRSLTYEEVQQ